jgi:threonine/homoserine/homoserine lactone efflux protein
MIVDSALISLLGFAVVMYITPGPNNVMVAASAANHSIRATVPHMFGIGFAVMLTLVCAGLGSAIVSWPLDQSQGLVDRRGRRRRISVAG